MRTRTDQSSDVHHDTLCISGRRIRVSQDMPRSWDRIVVGTECRRLGRPVKRCLDDIVKMQGRWRGVQAPANARSDCMCVQAGDIPPAFGAIMCNCVTENGAYIRHLLSLDFEICLPRQSSRSHFSSRRTGDGVTSILLKRSI